MSVAILTCEYGEMQSACLFVCVCEYGEMQSTTSQNPPNRATEISRYLAVQIQIEISV